MGLFVYGFGLLGGVTFSLFLMRYPNRLMHTALLLNIIAILSLAFFFIVDT